LEMGAGCMHDGWVVVAVVEGITHRSAYTKKSSPRTCRQVAILVSLSVL
jgi:hypothetical protein